MKKEKIKIRKVVSGYIALAMILTAISVIPRTTNAVLEEEGIEVPTLRVYGNASEGAGDRTVKDPKSCLGVVEDLPYTDAIAPFDPEHPQAPIKDSITFNPALLSETESSDELLGNPPLPAGPYDNLIKDIGQDRKEKVFFRMWYEPWHWDKDANGDKDFKGPDYDKILEPKYQRARYRPVYELQGKEKIDYDNDGTGEDWWEVLDQEDEIYPAIMQEFTYMFLEYTDNPLPKAATPSYNTYFLFPVGIRAEGTASEIEAKLWDPYGYGLNGLDMDFDGTPDEVHVMSERALFSYGRTLGMEGIAADFNGNHKIDAIDGDGYELSGDELVVFTSEVFHDKVIGDKIQFLDHMIEIVDIYSNAPDEPASVRLAIYYMGDVVPEFLGYQIVQARDMILVGRSLPVTYIKAVENGGNGTNLCDFPTGPWFAWIHAVDGEVDLMVGRALGATHSAMEDGEHQQDLRPGDPWWLKRFYVDGHEYNVVAIETVGKEESWTINLTVNDLDLEWDDESDDEVNPRPENTTEEKCKFKYITIRTPIPKMGERQNPVTHEMEYAYRDAEYSGANPPYYYIIEQHSVRLQPYFINDSLSVMPPYNYEHTILVDIQDEWSAIWNKTEYKWDVEPEFMGEVKVKVPPIVQTGGAYDYTVDYTTFDGRHISVEQLFYVEETLEEQFKGELLEIYKESYDSINEWWFDKQYHMLPDMYTEFVLPENNSLYLLTSSFLSSQAFGRILNQDKNDKDDIEELPSGYKHIITIEGGNRVKFWFDPSPLKAGETAGDRKKYKCEDGLRIYGFDNEGAGDTRKTVTDPLIDKRPESPPYTDPTGPIDPESGQAPRKDFVTFDPAYMDKYYNGGEELVDLYKLIGIEEHDAREKVFFRQWYEPWHWDKDADGDGNWTGNEYMQYDSLTGKRVPFYEHPYYQKWLSLNVPQLKDKEVLDANDVIYSALMQEFTYMYLDTFDQPAHGQPATSKLAFPMSTELEKLGHYDEDAEDFVEDGGIGDFGWGITSFDANYDGKDDIVTIHSEKSLAKKTGIGADFDASGDLQELDVDNYMNGNELVVLTVENLDLNESHPFAMFLDHVIRLKDVSADSATFYVWRSYGTTDLPKIPSTKSTVSLDVGEMVLYLDGHYKTKLSPGQNNLGSIETTGPWFLYLQALDGDENKVVVTIGRALGDTHTVIDDWEGLDLTPGDPWFMKRFYVDGHEYEVVAIKTVKVTPAEHSGDENYEFKYITIRTPVPKEPVEIGQHSTRLQEYLPCSDGYDQYISVMPPFNMEHTARKDVQAGWTHPNDLNDTNFDEYNWSKYKGEDEATQYMGKIIKNKPPLQIHIQKEDREEQFKGELKEKYNKKPQLRIVLNITDVDVYDGIVTIEADIKEGKIEGWSLDGDATIYITRVNIPDDGDGMVDGTFYIETSMFNDAEIRGKISGWYDHSEKMLYMTWYRDETYLDPDNGYIDEWFLCFWAEFENTTDLTLHQTDNDKYSNVATPNENDTWIGGWDPFDIYEDVDVGEEWEAWMTEQWHTMPDQYTEITLPGGQLYLLTSSWYAPEAIWRTVNEEDKGKTGELNVGSRFKFWYNPEDCDDIYVNTAWVGAPPTPELMEGDVNGDGCVDIIDAMWIAQYTVGARTLTAENLTCADVNDDGNVTIVDASWIAQWTVGTREIYDPVADADMLEPVPC